MQPCQCKPTKSLSVASHSLISLSFELYRTPPIPFSLLNTIIDSWYLKSESICHVVAAFRPYPQRVSITPSTGRGRGRHPPRGNSLSPGAPPLQHTKSDPSPPATEARRPRLRTKSTLSNVVVIAADIEVKNRGVIFPMVSMVPAQPMAGSSRSETPNGAISKGSKGGLIMEESQVTARNQSHPTSSIFPKPNRCNRGLGQTCAGKGSRGMLVCYRTSR